MDSLKDATIENIGENSLKHRQPTVYKTDAGIALL
jgi:hypothetical protein